MSDYSELKRVAERVIAIESTQDQPIQQAWDEFEAAANPGAVLALIAENERLRIDAADVNWMVEQRDQLKSEVETLTSQVKALQSDANSYQSGYDAGRAAAKAHSDSWRAEAEALRKDAERYRWVRVKQTFIWLIQDWFPKDNVLTDVDAEIDAAMSKESGHD